MKNITFSHQGKYICGCGKEFENSQAFNGHKSHCKIHLISKDETGAAYLANKVKQEEALKAAQIKAKINKNNLQLIKLNQWIAEQHTCEACGKIMSEKYGSGRFCCRACAHHRVLSEECREKIRQSLIITNQSNKTIIKNNKCYRVCKYCNKEFIVPHKATGKLAGNKYCSEECKILGRHNAISTGVKKSFEEGRNVGFIPRDKPSKLEDFWQRVLTSKNIPFEFNYTVTHTPTAICKGTWFSLDFYIQKDNIKIDFEVDGKQHTYKDRVIFDKERDKILTDLGYIVFRLSWKKFDSEILTSQVN